MIFQAGLCALAYAGVKLYQHLRYEVPTKLPAVSSSKPLLENAEEDSQKALALHDRHLKIGMVSLGVALIASHPLVVGANLALMAYTTFPIVRLAIRKFLKFRNISHDFLVMLFNGLCMVTGHYVALALGIVFYHFGKRTLAKAQEETKLQLSHIFAQQPMTVWVLKGRIEIEIPIESLKVGDIVVVSTSGVVPIDGSIIAGRAMIDQYALTGEANPAEKSKGDRVLASTVVISGAIQLLVEKAGTDTHIAQIGQMLDRTVEHKSSIQMKGEAWADWSALPMLGLAGVVHPFMGTLGSIKVLNFGYGNRIRLFGSLGTLNYLSVAAHQSILVKDGRVFEELSQIDTVLFDKTGTLTEECPQVGEIISCEGFTQEDVLLHAAAAEYKLSHPIAQAIVQEATSRQLFIPKIEDSDYQIGFGITVRFGSQKIRVGSARFIEESLGGPLPKMILELTKMAFRHGSSVVVVAVDDQVQGAIELQSSVRPEAYALIRRLRERGIDDIVIVSGDHPQPTQKLAQGLDVDRYFSEVLPKGKAAIVEQLQREGKRVCFVGDGVNDAIAMKQANVSISLKGATPVATDLAQVILMDSNLSQVDQLLTLSDQLTKQLQQSLWITLLPVAVCATGTFLGNFSILTVVIINEVIGQGAGIVHAMLPLKKQ